VCGSANEKKVLEDTSRIFAEKNKVCKRKDELRKIVTEGLLSLGYDAAICKSKWEKSPSFPAGILLSLSLCLSHTSENGNCCVGLDNSWKIAESLVLACKLIYSC